MAGTGCVATSLREYFDGAAVRIGSFRGSAAAPTCSSSSFGIPTKSWATRNRPNKVTPIHSPYSVRDAGRKLLKVISERVKIMFFHLLICLRLSSPRTQFVEAPSTYWLIDGRALLTLLKTGQFLPAKDSGRESREYPRRFAQLQSAGAGLRRIGGVGIIPALFSFLRKIKMIETLTSPAAQSAFLAETLPAHPLFEGMGERDRAIFAECSMRATFEAGDLVIEADQPANCMHLLISGRVALETPDPIDTVRVQSLGPGDVLGWSWLFPPYCWHFNAIAEERTETLFFYGSRLLQACNKNHDFGFELFRRLSGILVRHLEPTRAKWIQAARSSSPRSVTATNYLMI